MQSMSGWPARSRAAHLPCTDLVRIHASPGRRGLCAPRRVAVGAKEAVQRRIDGGVAQGHQQGEVLVETRAAALEGKVREGVEYALRE